MHKALERFDVRLILSLLHPYLTFVQRTLNVNMAFALDGIEVKIDQMHAIIVQSSSNPPQAVAAVPYALQ